MSEITTVGLDLAKNVFQVHGADSSGRAVLRRKLRRDQVLASFSQLGPCVVAMEACGGAHFWGTEIGKLGHEVRLIPPAYVKPFVKRQKNDAADAEAICEAAQRPTMRFVPVKSEETQGAAMVFRIRELLIRQRTQLINALRGHLTEFGQIVPQGAANAVRLIAIVEDPDSGLPVDAISTLKVLIAALVHLEAEIDKLDAEIARRAKENDVARRLMTVPPLGHVDMPCRATGHRTVDRHGHRGLGAAARDVPQGAGLCGLARPGATATLNGRQAAPRGNDEDGRTIPQAAADHRGQQRHHQAACPCRGPAGDLAGWDAGAQATDAGAGRLGEQDGADRLGPDGPGRRLPVSGRGGMSPL